jgi:Spy/CpxP family protein refolding chaperone
MNPNSGRFSLLAVTAILAVAIAAGSTSQAFAKPPVPAPPNSPTLTQQSDLGTVLNLTAEQKKKIQAISAARGKDIIAALTPVQRQKFIAAVKSGKPAVQVLQSLDLSVDQKKKIFNILKDNSDQIKAVLTPEQIKKVQQLQAQKQTKPK